MPCALTIWKYNLKSEKRKESKRQSRIALLIIIKVIQIERMRMILCRYTISKILGKTEGDWGNYVKLLAVLHVH
jgi:hypothetical protein